MEIEESSQNCSDSEDSSGSQSSSTVESEDIESDLEVLKSTITLTFVSTQPLWRGIFLHITLLNS